MTLEEFKKQYKDHYLTDIKWSEMDAMQHVNNANFFRYFECARIVLWERMRAMSQGKTLDTIGPILAATSCRFRRPLYYPDKIAIGAKIKSKESDRFTMEHVIWSEREQALVGEGDAVVVAYDYEQKKKAQLPKAWLEFMEQN